MPESKTSREIKELTLLFEISTKLSETLDLKTILQPILQRRLSADFFPNPELGFGRAILGQRRLSLEGIK